MLDMFFNPKSVAVIGASATPGKLGHDVLANLQTSGYRGDLYPVNPRGGEILGLTAYPSWCRRPLWPASSKSRGKRASRAR